MNGLDFIKNVAARYIILLFVSTLIGQPVLNGIVLTNQNSIVISNSIIEEESNEEVADDDSSETYVDFHLPKYDYLVFKTLYVETSKLIVSKKLSLTIDMFIPPPELI